MPNKEPSKHSEYYQRNKERRKTERREYYAKQKQQTQLSVQKLYRAQSIQVLLSLKEYSESSPAKKKLWLDFRWTFQDCQRTGFYDIIQIQKLEWVASNLARDYYQTAQEKSKGSWNKLSEKKQNRLIKSWGQEKARLEQELAQGLVEQEEKGKAYEKEIEMAKFHEERGKIKCECWQCEGKKELERDLSESESEQCPECEGWVEELGEEDGVCGKCLESYEG